MYEVKKQIYPALTKNQKSAICNFLRALVKKSEDLNADEILNKFIDDEKYYLEISASRFEFLSELLYDNTFLADTELYIKECKKYYDYKKKQEPLKQAKKEFEKKMRKQAQDFKMGKEPPTQKQLYYYDKLCQKYNIEKKELSSKLEARDEIDKIITEHENDNSL
ncbi:MAG: hypothetical protein VZR09_04015 [Candidatus Gastranaerophilaceae bacterium]|nr:hypothetical protein [Candidatus Gastranaerophilaceae bacterium]